MGQHIREGEKRETKTISVRPSKWKAFQASISEKCPGESASGHLEEMMIQETARLLGEEVTHTVNTASLKRQLKSLSRERHDIKLILDRTKALQRIEHMTDAYDLQATMSNAKQVIAKMIRDHNKEDTPAHNFLTHNSQYVSPIAESEFQHAISMIQIDLKTSEVTKQLLEAQQHLYGETAITA